MKKIIVVFFVIFCNFFVYTQNLVKNPSFEAYYILPDSLYQLGDRIQDTASICKFWDKTNRTTPDYYHIRSMHKRHKIPCTILGCHPVFSEIDSAFIGFIPITYYGATEPFSGELSQPLQQGKKYEVSFYYKYAVEASYSYLDKIEVMMSKDLKMFKKIGGGGMYKNIVKPEMKANVELNDNLINDGEWHQIKGYYDAIGGEKHISFGIFYQSEKFIKIIDEYVGYNFVIGWNKEKESKFLKKYKNDLSFIHKNPYYKGVNGDYKVQVEMNTNQETNNYIMKERLSYYFLDHVSVLEITE
jgi:hypothetical protein